ncbi:hypothetical protein ABIF65_003709 [Bradyrhizobium japonicum]|jgi:hypothetical protein|uniref:hypothetical protein n=1 Tax=Bradyrhizobium liaoningense TaxID=43992 RepID=UPI0004AFF693|nr:hypothetical protein [Bradyrhizobium liaoningense]MBR1030087.1 hypothetical protein [Bradyrhizobium liaoningense]
MQAFIAFCIANPMFPAAILFAVSVLAWIILAAFECSDVSPRSRRRARRRRYVRR